jgi:hypothetical protein
VNRDDFLTLSGQNYNNRVEIMRRKGAAYSGQEDVFANFKRNAEKLGLSKYQVWLIYFVKHIDAITNSIKAQPHQPVEQTEGMFGRIQDSTNYLDLLAGMLEEDGILTRSESVRSSRDVATALVERLDKIAPFVIGAQLRRDIEIAFKHVLESDSQSNR